MTVPICSCYTFNTPTSAAAECSPVSEFYNTNTSIDWIFMSASAHVTESGGNTTCTGACVLNFNVTTSPNKAGTPTTGLAETGGTSGIIIDNAASGGGSEIYFTTIGRLDLCWQRNNQQRHRKLRSAGYPSGPAVIFFD
jgi:hypothetical protein